MRRRASIALGGVLAALVVVPPALGAFADDEQKNYSKTGERDRYITQTSAFQARLNQANADSPREVATILANDPERSSMTRSLCHEHINGCAGDVRFYDWDKRPGNIRRPVLWTARSGATISGHVWEVQGAGRSPKPGIVITSGSVQAPEELYWAQAAALARDGYVVLTWDPQTQGRSDSSGAFPTAGENSAPQSTGAFTEGTVDALDFFNSTPSNQYRPRNSATNPAVNHSDKQIRRVAAGKDAAFNPLYGSLDRSRLGIAGHSLGAFAVSQVGARDHRVRAVVAWDQLNTDGKGPGGMSSGGPNPPRVPGLGFSGDYGIGGAGCAAGVTPVPCTKPPDPQSASTASHDFSRAGVATAQVNTRAGTHFEPSYIPNAGFGATFRGIDQWAWYTLAWFDRFVKGGDSTADARLLTNRWQKDSASGRIDPTKDPNLFSKYVRSRVDFRRANGQRALCEDLRNGCGLLADDNLGAFSVVDFAFGQAPFRPRRCATSLRATARYDLSRRHRIRVRVGLPFRSRVNAVVRRGARRTRFAVTRRHLRPGRRLFTLRVSRRARPGRHRLKVRVFCGARRSQVVTRRIRFVP